VSPGKFGMAQAEIALVRIGRVWGHFRIGFMVICCRGFPILYPRDMSMSSEWYGQPSRAGSGGCGGDLGPKLNEDTDLIRE